MLTEIAQHLDLRSLLVKKYSVNILNQQSLTLKNTMINLDINYIQQNLSGFIKLIQEGKSLIITQADQPIAEIKPISIKQPEKTRRPIGLCEGEFIVPDNFNDPLPQEIIKLFENS